MHRRIFAWLESDNVATIASACLALLLVVTFQFGAFFGTRLIPYDTVSLNYPWYVNAILAARHGVFTALNPFHMGGIPNYTLPAFFDVFYWIPLITGGIPTLYQHQLLVLFHACMIPIALISLARLYGMRGPRLYLVGVVGFIACYLGPVVKYMETANGIDTYAWGFVGFAALEYFRARGRLAYAVVAAFSFVFAFTRFSEAGVLWPLVLIGYVICAWPDISAHKRGAPKLGFAALIGLAVLLPAIILQLKWFHTATVTLDVKPVEEATRGSIAAFLGFAPVLPDGSLGNDLFAMPGILVAMIAIAFQNMSWRWRIFYGAFLGTLLIYTFGTAIGGTWYEHAFRTIYLPASFARRPYAGLYIVLPVLIIMLTKHVLAIDVTRLNYRHLFTATAVGLTVMMLFLAPHLWLLDLIAGTLTILFCAGWRLGAIGLAAALVVQWALVVYAPNAMSSFYPHVRQAGTELLEPYSSIVQYLTPETSDASKLYRIFGVGMPGEWGSLSDIFQFYDVGPDPGSMYPRNLEQRTKIFEIRENKVTPFIMAHPDVVGSLGMEEMSVRYYIVGGESFTQFQRLALDGKPWLRTLPTLGYWHVIEDTRWQPFLTAIGSAPNDRVTADVHWDTLQITVPQNTSEIRLSYIYDPWWHASVVGTSHTEIAVQNDGGQLQLSTKGLGGQTVILRYGSSAYSAAVAIALLVYVGVGLWLGYNMFLRIKTFMGEEAPKKASA